MLESTLERRLKREVERRGGLADKFTVPSKCGMPDRIILLPGGRTIFVEMKAPGKKPTMMQLKRAKELRAKGFEVYYLDSVASINSFLSEVFPS